MERVDKEEIGRMDKGLRIWTLRVEAYSPSQAIFFLSLDKEMFLSDSFKICILKKKMQSICLKHSDSLRIGQEKCGRKPCLDKKW